MKHLFSICFVILLVFYSFSQESTKKRKKEIVLIETEYGDIKIKLYNETPQHKENFLSLIEKGFYNDLLFHRVINQFMIQGGDPDSKTANEKTVLGNGGPGYTIPAEFVSKYFHKKGALAAARLGDAQNPEKQSSGSQFYIVHGKTFTSNDLKMMENQKNGHAKQNIFNNFLKQEENKAYLEKLKVLTEEGNQEEIKRLMAELEPLVELEFEKQGITGFSKAQIDAYTSIGGAPHLDGSYTVFGEVIEGLDVIDKIAAVAVDDRNRPTTDVAMKIKLIKK